MNQGDEQDVAADIVRAFEEAAIGTHREPSQREDHPDAVRLMDKALRRSEAALWTNVLPFVRRPEPA